MNPATFLLALAAAALAPTAAFAGDVDQADRIGRGAYQAVLGDCAGCHTAPGGAPFAGGAPIATPFGTLIPPNITPDRDTGIGDWSLDDFRSAMTRGVGHDGIRLYPAMPYPNYAKMPEPDIDDLWAFLGTIAPVKNDVDANQLPFPFSIRTLMIGWNLLEFTPKPFAPDAAQSAEWNRGAYLVQGPAHCGACHTPKTIFGGDDAGKALTGASLQGWWAPDITAAPTTGVGSWSKEELVAYLATGVNGHTIASGPMAEAIAASTSKMTPEDLGAIATYLKTLGPSDAARPTPLAASDPAMKHGAAIYVDNCSACHGGRGEGSKDLFPALASSPIVAQADATTLARMVVIGSQGVHTAAKPTTPAMPSLGWRLDDAAVADVLTFVRNSWGNAAARVTPGTVAKLRN
ncbi:c-type cytochrome [Siculibacillus lacustris]|uniref:C-type cytochrome n=1 Tax=Siculibacillus lacustris TaxID=1549641 RepID=A0A4Q9VUW8_9HYPH|nr:cytochrome c [Siculibacillus lacustris]TBW38963.1 c-type cytochrome [Siculibacillus lacustris]